MVAQTTQLDGLLELGRRQGGLTAEDLRHALPLETMSAEDLAGVVAGLEEAGVDVEIDPTLLKAHPGRAGLHKRESGPMPGAHHEAAISRPDVPSSARTVAGPRPTAEREPKRVQPRDRGRSSLVILAAVIGLALAVWILWRLV